MTLITDSMCEHGNQAQFEELTPATLQHNTRPSIAFATIRLQRLQIEIFSFSDSECVRMSAEL